MHGTWARKSAWTKPGSPLRERLAAEYPDADIERFEWSGANRHRPRERAAEALRSRILDNPVPTVIVAHSHGGNVAEQSLTGFDALHARTRIVAVGTPFLRFTDRRFGSIERSAAFDTSRVSWLLFSALAGLGFLAGLIRLGIQPGNAESAETLSTWLPLSPMTSGLAGLSVGVAGLVAPLIGFVLGVTVLNLAWRWARTPHWLTMFRASQVATVEDPEGLDELDPDTAQAIAEHHARLREVGEALRDISQPPPMATVRTVRDEAAMGLRIGTLLASATDLVRKALDRIPSAFGMASFLFAIFALALVFDEGMAADEVTLGAAAGSILLGFPYPEFAALVATAVALPSTLALALTAVPVAEAIACGFDGVRFLSHGRVSMTSEPRRLVRETQVELTPGRRGLRHSRLMNDPSSIDAIALACRDAFDTFEIGEPRRGDVG